MPDVLLALSDEDAAALATVARRYDQTPAERVLLWIRDPLDEARKVTQADRWNARRRAIEADAALAAIVDAETPPDAPRGLSALAAAFVHVPAPAPAPRAASVRKKARR